jgi:bla regulator protein blaR1
MIPLQPLANHLWQSTLFAAVAGLMTLALRRNRAQTRYWLWLAASVKFLIPFSVLVDMGSHFGRHTAPAMTQSVLPFVIEQVTQPFAAPVTLPTMSAAAQPSLASWIPAVLCVLWAIGLVTLASSWWMRWRSLRAALRTASPLHLAIGASKNHRRQDRPRYQVLTSPAFAEPGVFGIRRPVLLLPSGITNCLTPPQLEAILAHELCHVRRRDNLASAIHMAVEAVFWFHPLVWWLGARLMEERERACDEEVLVLGSEPQVYAEGILKICELYLASPLPCVSGVTGANLKKRIEEIMTNRAALRLNFAKKVALVTAGVTALAAPVIVGFLNAPAILAQSPQAAQSVAVARPAFEVASVKPCKDGASGGRAGGSSSPGRLNVNCQTVKGLIITAYVLFADGQHQPSSSLKLLPVEGGPAWINSDRYDADAKAEGPASPEMMQGPMLQTLLEDRFKLKIHRETREIPVYALAVAKSGLKLQRAEGGSCTPRDLTKSPQPRPQPGQRPFCGSARLAARKGPNFTWEMHAMSLDEFSKWLNLGLDRLVIDKTGITERFDFRLEFASDETTPGLLPGGGDSGDPPGPSIFTALQQQLGLKLEPAKGPGGLLAIDHVERPSGN